MQSHEIHNLDIYTQYLVTLQVFNPEGLGPQTTVLVMTDEGGELNFDVIILLNSRTNLKNTQRNGTRERRRKLEFNIIICLESKNNTKKTIWGI